MRGKDNSYSSDQDKVSGSIRYVNGVKEKAFSVQKRNVKRTAETCNEEHYRILKKKYVTNNTHFKGIHLQNTVEYVLKYSAMQ